MRASIVLTVLRREWAELTRNPVLLATIVIPPLILTAAPLLLIVVSRQETLPARFVVELRQAHPEWAALDATRLTIAYAVQQFLAMFLLAPAYIPLSIATFSIIGEKQSRSLEAVLATPIRTSELLAGKALAALAPGLVAGWLSYAVFAVGAALIEGAWLVEVVTAPAWLIATFVLGPATGFVSVVLGVLVSSRVSDPRTAQQIGAVVVIPIVTIVVLQATNLLPAGPTLFLLLAAAFVVAGVLLLAVGVRLFGRETILTRWR